MTFDLSLGDSAGFRSLHRLVMRPLSVIAPLGVSGGFSWTVESDDSIKYSRIIQFQPNSQSCGFVAQQ